MIRVCFFNTTRFWGGGEKWHFETASYFASQGHKVFCVVHSKGQLFLRLADKPLQVLPVEVSNLSFLNPLKFLMLVNWFRSQKIQIVIFNGPSDVKLGAPAASLAGVQSLVYRRGLAVPVKNSVLNRWLYRHKITHFLTNSEATAKLLFQDLIVPNAQKKTRIIYNGIDLSHFKGPVRKPPNRAQDAKILIGTAGRLEWQKGHHQLLTAACHLKTKGLDFELLIAGEGSRRQALADQIQKAGLSGSVHLKGFVHNMADFMGRIDIFAFPSLWEGFGYAAAEAMAAGRPVVAFDISSNREVIANGVTGLLVPPGDIEAFSESLFRLSANPCLRARMGCQGRARVAALFDKAVQLQKLEAFLCEEVLEPEVKSRKGKSCCAEGR